MRYKIMRDRFQSYWVVNRAYSPDLGAGVGGYSTRSRELWAFDSPGPPWLTVAELLQAVTCRLAGAVPGTPPGLLLILLLSKF